MKHYFTRTNYIYYIMPGEENIPETDNIIQYVKTIRFRVTLRNFSDVDQPIVFQVDIGDDIVEPINTTDKDESENVDDSNPKFMSHDSLKIQQVHYDKQDDFSFHKVPKSTMVINIKRHQSVMTLEQSATKVM